MGNSSHSLDGVKLEILPTLIEVFLRHLIFCRRKAFYEDGYNKIHELSNYKRNLISRFNVLQEMSTALGSKKSFLKKWNSLLNINGTLNIKFQSLYSSNYISQNSYTPLSQLPSSGQFIRNIDQTGKYHEMPLVRKLKWFCNPTEKSKKAQQSHHFLQRLGVF